MSHRIDSELLDIDGTSVRVSYYHDEDGGRPWERCDGHGPVRVSHYRHNKYDSDKRPGERPMNRAGYRDYQYYYDWQEACKLARKDGWNAQPYDAPNRVLRAVQADFDFLSAWVNDDWHYVGIEVQIVDNDGDPVGESDSCWGFESYKDYHKEAARNMAAELVNSFIKEPA